MPWQRIEKVSPIPQLALCLKVTTNNWFTAVSLALLCYSVFPFFLHPLYRFPLAQTSDLFYGVEELFLSYFHISIRKNPSGGTNL